MEVLLVRHGKTAGNIARRYIGSTDEPLCDEGIEHAKCSGADDSVETVYVSPMKRAQETAKIKFPNAVLTICADLREMDFGDFECRSAEEMVEDPAYRRWVDSNCTLPCPNGEQMSGFSDRICRAFDAIVQACIDRGDERLVLVAHGGTLMSILDRYAVPQKKYYEWYVDNCGGYRACLDADTWAHSPVLSACEKFGSISEPMPPP
jgi:alpha-ribazole phosphatase